MKLVLLSLLLLGVNCIAYGQQDSITRIQKVESDVERVIKNAGLDSSLTQILLAENKNLFKKIDEVKDDPDAYDKTWNKLADLLTSKAPKAGYWMNALNIDFKTFQMEDTSVMSLGIAYDLTLEKGIIYRNPNGKHGFSGSLNTKGNIAFNKNINPVNFLENKLSLKFFQSFGGVSLSLSKDSVHYRILQLLPVLMRYSNVNDIKKSNEWNEMQQLFRLENSYLYSVNVNGGFESNQDFTKIQYAFGSLVSVSAKSWENDNLLTKLNLLDYPFALTRLVSKYDNKFTLNGTTLPVLSAGIDYVVSSEDNERKNIEQELEPFFRFKAEAGFRSVVAKASGHTVYFNAVYKFFNELGANEPIKAAKLHQYQYFNLSLVSDKGFFVSYSHGRLPFDRKDDAIYELGFSYKFK